MPPNPSSRLKARGFSLLELLLVLTLVPVVSFTAYSNLSSGIKLWNSLNRPIIEEELQLFQNKASRDFLSAICFSTIPFQGDAETTSFVSIIKAPAELGGERGIGQVTYGYDASLRAIVREEKDYSQFSNDKPGRKLPVLDGVNSCSLSYLVYDDQAREHVWSDVWAGKANEAPAAVRFTYSILREGQARDTEETFYVPVGGK